MTSGIAFPKSLKNMTFGHRFDQSLTGFTFPIALESLTFGPSFNQSLQNAALPGKLQVLTFGQDFNQSLEGVCFPSSLQSLTFGYCFDQSLDGVQLPHGLKSLIFGDCFDQSLEQVDLPSGLEEFNWRLGRVSGWTRAPHLGFCLHTYKSWLATADLSTAMSWNAYICSSYRLQAVMCSYAFLSFLEAKKSIKLSAKRRCHSV